jgi:hypothetical protein
MDNETDLSTIIDGAGPIAGFFVLLLGIAIVLLWLNMNRQVKRIDPDLPRGAREAQVDQELNEIAELEQPDEPKE